MHVPLFGNSPAVVPVLIGPIALLWSMLPAILIGIGGLLLSIFKPSTAKKLAAFLWRQKLLSLGVIAVIWLAFWGPEWTFLHHHGTDAGAGGKDWPAFRGGPLRLGAAPGAVDPTIGKIVWTYNKYPMVYSTPTVRGDRVYVTTMHIPAMGSDDGAVVCLDAKTGAEIWRYSVGGYRATFSSPSISGDYLVCGEGLHWYQHARMTCLDLKHDGQKLWQYQTNYHVETSPCIYDGKAYFGAGHDGYYCIALKPDPDGKPHLIWHLHGANYQGSESCPIVSDGVLYVGLGNDGQAVLAINADTGEEIWRIPTHYPVFAPPTISNGKMYIGMGNGDFVNDADAVRPVKIEKMRKAGKSPAEIAEAAKWLGAAGEVWRIDLKTHHIDWKFHMAKTVLGCLPLRNGKLYFGSGDGMFYCLSADDGKVVRQWDAHDAILSSPAVGTDHIYLVTKKGHLYCLTADTLKPVWDMSLGSGNLFAGSPTLALDHIYVGTMNDGLRCVGVAGAPLPPVWTNGERGGYARAGVWPVRGAHDWHYPSEATPDFQVTAPLMALDGFAYAAVTRSGHPEFLKLKMDRNLHDAERLVWSAPFDRQVTIAPAGVAHLLYVVDGDKGDSGRALHALDAAGKTQVWRFPIKTDASGCFTVNPQRVVIWSGPSSLVSLDALTGKTQWARETGLGVSAGSPQLFDGMVVAATTTGLTVLDDQSGEILLQTPVAGATFSPICAGSEVVLATETGIEVRSLQNGQEIWRKDIGPCSVPPIADEDRVAAVTAKGELYEFRLRDGLLLARETGADPAIPAFFATADATIYHTPAALMSIEVNTANPTTNPSTDRVDPDRWYGPTTWLGTLRTPLVASEQHLLFAASKEGIICLWPKKQ